MKIIHNINKWSFIITLLLYCTIYFGILAQIPLGAIQLLLAIVLLYKWNTLDSITGKHLILYFVIVSVYGLLFLTDITETLLVILYFTVIPMAIAGYFLYITYRASKGLQFQNQKTIQV